jgi:hypothetical protein
MLLCLCTDNCKVATLHETTKSSINCNQHISSTESFAVQLNKGFGRAHHADASTEVHCQTAEHTPRPEMRSVQHGLPAKEGILVVVLSSVDDSDAGWTRVCCTLQLMGDVRSVQHGPPAKEGILVKSYCLLWMTPTLGVDSFWGPAEAQRRHTNQPTPSIEAPVV